MKYKLIEYPELKVKVEEAKLVFEVEKEEKFRTRFFDHLDGKSSERTVQLIEKALAE